MKPLIRLMATFGNEGAEQVRLRCALDTGLSCGVLPEWAWRPLSLAPSGALTQCQRDGTTVSRATAACTVSTHFGETRMTVMLGDAADRAVLPAALLQEFGLMPHPFSRTVMVMPMAREV